MRGFVWDRLPESKKREIFLNRLNILKLLNVKYILSTQKLNSPSLKLINKTKIYCPESKIYSNIYLYELIDYLPRVYLVSSYKILKDKYYSLLNKMNIKEEVLCEEAISLKNNLNFDKKHSFCKLIEYSDNKLIIESQVKGEGAILVLSNAYMPGWKVYIDKKPTTIYIANYFLQAIFLPEGKHIVEFIYSPFLFKLGFIISIVSFLLNIFIFIIKQR